MPDFFTFVLAGADVAGLLQLLLQPDHLLHLQLRVPRGLPQDPHPEDLLQTLVILRATGAAAALRRCPCLMQTKVIA